MYDDLSIINYPDPRLSTVSKPVETFDESLASLTAKMFELMRGAKGVGLAAPQVGINRRLFVMNPSGEPADDLIVVNPELLDLEGSEQSEEGCLSLPDLRVQIDRAKSARLKAYDMHGRPFEQSATGYIARIWQHEFDHLNGILLTDRMGTVARALHRSMLRELEKQYEAAHPAPPPVVKKKTLRRTRRRA
jgi:peptide deformylase